MRKRFPPATAAAAVALIRYVVFPRHIPSLIQPGDRQCEMCIFFSRRFVSGVEMICAIYPTIADVCECNVLVVYSTINLSEIAASVG